MEQCIAYDTKKSGKISLTDLRRVLFDSKLIALTPLQVQILLGTGKPDRAGLINYKDFAFKAKDMMDTLFSLRSLNKMAAIIEKEEVKREEVRDAGITSLDLFKVRSVANPRAALQEVRQEPERHARDARVRRLPARRRDRAH